MINELRNFDAFISQITIWNYFIEALKARTTDNNLVYRFIFVLPSSPPSFTILSKEGITIANNWITIEAVI